MNDTIVCPPCLVTMYTQFFGLREMPFSITPDPAYLYMSPRHQEALGHLLYGTGQYGGFVQLTGEVGTGKTTIIRTLLEQKLESVDVAMIHNPRQSDVEFLQSLCDELGTAYDRQHCTLKSLVDALNQHLLATHAKGRRVVLIIDEAQNLDPGVLEQVRLLTNLETHKEKLLRIMLVGQPELQELLARPDLRQLAQRISARYHLTPLTAAETSEYVRHRLRVSGAQQEIFQPDALDLIYIESRGVPRVINVLCDRALLGAYSLNQRSVSIEVVRDAVREVMLRPEQSASRRSQRSRATQRPMHRFWVSTEKLWAPLALLFAGMFFYEQLRQWMQAAPASAPITVAAQSQSDSQTPPTATPTASSPPAHAAAAKPPTSQATAPTANVDTLAQPLPALVNRLIAVWDLDVRVEPGQNICRALREKGLLCHRANTTLARLQRMNRPAVLSLKSDSQTPRHVLLRALSETEAALDTVTGIQRIPRKELEQRWSGEYLVLWRSENGATLIDRETRGETIIWLRRSLLLAAGRKPSANLSGRFDEQLGKTLKRFQERRGLEPTGVADSPTLMLLGANAKGGPKLSDDLP